MRHVLERVMVLALLGLASVAVPGLRAQVRSTNLGGIDVCSDCELTPTLALSLGEATGDGIIESEWSDVVRDTSSGSYAVFRVGGARVALFDSAGVFIRSIGRRGGGPGEIGQLVDVQFLRSNILVLDYVGPKLMAMDLEGRHLWDFRLPVRAGRFRVTGDSVVVVGSMDRSPQLVGYPLHGIRVPTGQVVAHFGSTDGEWDVRTPFAQRVPLGWSARRELVWKGEVGRLALQQWDLNGRLIQEVTGELDWFPPLQHVESAGPPPTTLQDFGTDGAGRLWLLVRVPDDGWRDTPTAGREGLITPEHFDDYWDTRVDVFDLAHRAHLGSLRWDEAWVGLVQVDGGFLLRKVTYSTDGVPALSFYRLPSLTH